MSRGFVKQWKELWSERCIGYKPNNKRTYVRISPNPARNPQLDIGRKRPACLTSRC